MVMRDEQTIPKRAASELDQRVAERISDLAEANAELQVQVGLLQHLPISAWTLNPDGTPDFVNQVWLEFSGQTLDFVRSHPEAWMTAVHPDDRETASKAFWEGVRSGHGFAFETRSLRAQDGTYRWHLQQTVALRDAEGNVLKFVGTTTDIDDQKRAQEELRASENNFRQIVDSIPGLAGTLRPSGEVEFLNQQFLDFFGKSQDEIKNWKINDALHPDDGPRVTTAFAHAITRGTPLNIEHRFRRRDGVFRWFDARLSPAHGPGGQIARWYFLASDVEDRKRSEEKLQRSEAFLAEGQRLSLTGTFSWNLDTDEVVLSEEACRIFKFDPHGSVTLERIRDRVHPDDIALLTEKIAGARTTGEADDYEIRLRMPNGSIKYVHTVSHATKHPDGRLEHIGAIQDVTERRRAEDALNELRSELAHMARVSSLGALTASITHEINQPLSGIVTNTSTCQRMLASDPPNIDGARETARRALRDCNRASQVITRLRSLFTKKDVTMESVDVNEAAQEVTALLLSELQRNGVMVRQELADDLPLVTGDRVQLQQVILNLVRNGSEAMSSIDDRPRQLIIRTEREGDSVRLTVQDAGTGINPQNADKLFDAFYTTKGDGMGMGLSVSRTIIESHRGRLWAAPNDGPGATFAFSLPHTFDDVANSQNAT
jgi:PAS domain S-box-containing protein